MGYFAASLRLEFSVLILIPRSSPAQAQQYAFLQRSGDPTSREDFAFRGDVDGEYPVEMCSCLPPSGRREWARAGWSRLQGWEAEGGGSLQTGCTSRTGARDTVESSIINISRHSKEDSTIGRVENSKNVILTNGYRFLNVLWYIENGYNFFWPSATFIYVIWAVLGYQKWYFGCPNQNSKNTFQY